MQMLKKKRLQKKNHKSSTPAIQMLCFCRAQKIHKIILMYFGEIVFPFSHWELGGQLLGISKS